MTAHIGVAAIHPLLARLRATGISLGAFLAPFGLAPEAVADPDRRIALELLDPMWQCAADLSGDGDFGLHAAESVTAGSFGMISYLGVTSPTWRTGLDRVCAFFRLFSDASSYQLELDDATARVIATHDVAPSGPVRHRVEFTVAVLACYGRLCVDGPWALDDVFLEHPAPTTPSAPAGLAEHRRIFGCVPRFDAPRSGFAFAARLLDCPLRTSDPALHHILAQQADHALASHAPVPTASAAVRALLARTGPVGELSLSRAARQLGMSPRTLQRRLRDEGTTLARLVEDSRRAMAAQLLARGDLSVGEVAFALGFSEPAAFHHAFKRWTGLTPSAYRRASR